MHQNCADLAYYDQASSTNYIGSGWIYKAAGNIRYIVTGAHVGRVYNNLHSGNHNPNSRYSNKIFATVYSIKHSKHVTIRCTAVAACARSDILLLRPNNGGTSNNGSAFDDDVLSENTGLTFGDSRSMNPGDDCFIVGNPSGFDVLSISHGNVRDGKHLNIYNVETMFVTAPSLGGNSGGPILNSDNGVIGMLNFGLTNTETMGGGVAQRIMQPVIKHLAHQVASATHSINFATVEYQKAAFNATASIVTTAQMMSISAMQGINRTRHGGVKFTSPGNSSPFTNNDILVELTYTPNKTYDPNYNSSATPVTLTINQWTGESPTNATWFIDASNVGTVSMKVLRNNSIITIDSLTWGTHMTYMTANNDIPLTSTNNQSLPL